MAALTQFSSKQAAFVGKPSSCAPGLVAKPQRGSLQVRMFHCEVLGNVANCVVGARSQQRCAWDIMNGDTARAAAAHSCPLLRAKHGARGYLHLRRCQCIIKETLGHRAAAHVQLGAAPGPMAKAGFWVGNPAMHSRAARFVFAHPILHIVMHIMSSPPCGSPSTGSELHHLLTQ